MSALVLALVLQAQEGRAGEIPLGERRSGYADMAAETRTMQDDDAGNPGMLWVTEGEAQWKGQPAAGKPSCEKCHGNAAISMRGVTLRYPLVAVDGRPLTLEHRINDCRRTQQSVAPLAWESAGLLALSAYIGFQSRGMAIEAPAGAMAQAYVDAGRALFRRRQGQLNLACSQCHDDYRGRRLGGNLIPQAHPTGHPIYRLEWQGMGSLQRRLRSCMAALRADPYDFGAPELLALEFYLKWRARGMLWEGPTVRP